jgi:hypothetical protein
LFPSGGQSTEQDVDRLVGFLEVSIAVVVLLLSFLVMRVLALEYS